MNPRNKRLWNISSNPELILFHIMAFHAQAVTTTNESQRIGAGGEKEKLHTMGEKEEGKKEKKSCKWFITSFQTLVPQLIYLCCCY